eukprot:13169081-Alexandrium_andersonii.AAC.1
MGGDRIGRRASLGLLLQDRGTGPDGRGIGRSIPLDELIPRVVGVVARLPPDLRGLTLGCRGLGRRGRLPRNECRAELGLPPIAGATRPPIVLHELLVSVEHVAPHDCLLYTSPSPRD